ncbi:hypothetical protein YTPLAS18_38850 [Nitrospira sp.]|nr:hypothetical protein YTPLAS18_38850 [Nitrospira sp.]
MLKPAYRRIAACPLGSLVALTLLNGCATDLYQQRADKVKDHTASFYRELRDDRIAAAVAENERIEGMALEMERGLLKQVSGMDANQKAREWSLIKITNQTAIENWLNLGRYLAQTKRYDRARGAYQRVVETYQGKGSQYAPFVERARLGLKDLDLIVKPSSGS